MFIYVNRQARNGNEFWLAFIRSDDMAPVPVAYRRFQDGTLCESWHIAKDPIELAPPITDAVSRDLKRSVKASIDRAFYRRDSEHRPPNCDSDIYDMRQLLDRFGPEYLLLIDQPARHAADVAIEETSKEIRRLRGLLREHGIDPDPLAE